MATENSGCDTGLVLGLGYQSWVSTQPAAEVRRRRGGAVKAEPKEAPQRKTAAEPLLTLSLSDGTYHGVSDVSSFSNPALTASVKKEKDTANEEDEADRLSSRISDEEDGNARKKLRLTKDQSSLLEEKFKEHSTLNPKQKQALARQLNLRPRQVEVWFQNRRARTKLKQTEVDCEFLKRCCKNLTEENRKLQKELQELRAIRFAQPLYMQLPATTITLCPSCERITTATNDVAKCPSPAAGHLALPPKTYLYNTFTAANPPPAAC
ncbi:homeobox-leucine zipper protein HAT22-like [Wolffia australiana]